MEAVRGTGWRLTRRRAIGLLAAMAASPVAGAAAEPVLRAIPRTDEKLPALGLGTWQVLDVGAGGAEFEAAREAVRGFLDAGGRVIDSSPMYGRSEERIGDILGSLEATTHPFLATKIWTTGRSAGEAQLAQSQRLLRAKQLDLVQVHNLQDVDTHLPMLRDAQEAGTVRYLGVTHYVAEAHAELERVIRREKPDFLQVNYSLAEPEAGQRLLPVARDLGVAVMVNRPFAQGGMIGRAAGGGLPPVAVELGCRSAAQLFVKWVLGDPAVTVILAATRNPRHAAENLEAASGAVPDAVQRQAIADWFAAF
jgi:aryl-alcohol dehydrogenase-like predicted oxidoreductase